MSEPVRQNDVFAIDDALQGEAHARVRVSSGRAGRNRNPVLGRPVALGGKSDLLPLDTSRVLSELSEGRGLVRQLVEALEARNDRVVELEAASARLQAQLASAASVSRLARMEDELSTYKKAKRIADLEIIETRALARDAEQQVERLRRTFSFRLGQLLVEGFSSTQGFLALPRGLLALRRDALAQSKNGAAKQTGATAMRPADHVHEIALVREKVAEQGAAAAAQWVRKRALKPALTARLLIEIAKDIRRSDAALAVRLGTEALQLDRTESRVKWLAMALADAGEITQPAELMRDAIRAGAQLNGTELRFAEELFALERLLKDPPHLLPAQPRRAGEIRRILLLASQSLPFHWSAATLRLHHMALAIQASGREVLVATLPGYPKLDAGRDAEVKPRIVDGIRYHTLPPVSVPIDLVDAFVPDSLPLVAAFARRHEVEALQAGGDVVSSLIGLSAGRALGLPVILGFGGDERLPIPAGITDRETERVALTRVLRQRLLDEADATILHLPLPTEYLDGSAAQASLALFDGVPSRPADAADADKPRLRDTPKLRGRIVLGFIGEPTADYDFECLASILDTLASGQDKARDPALLLAGTGRRFDALRNTIAAAGHEERLVFVPRPALTDLAGTYAAIDIFVAPAIECRCLTRAPVEVVLALAHGLPVVAPDLPATRSWRDAGLPVILAEGEDGTALAQAVAALVDDEARRQSAATAARDWAADHTALDVVGADLDGLYRRIAPIAANGGR